MPCVSVRNNHARKASIKAATIEHKNNRKNTRLAKKQQSVAIKTAKAQAKNSAKALKARQSLEKRVTKKHQARRAKVKATRAKALKAQAKAAAKTAKFAAKTQTKAAAKSMKLATKAAKVQSRAQAKAATQTAKLAKSQAKAQSRATKVNQLKTSLKKVKLPQLKPAVSKTIAKLSAAKSTRTQAKTAAKSAKAQAKAAKISAKKQIKAQKAQELSAEASRAAKISGTSVQSSFKIPHARAESQDSASNYTPAYSHAPTRTVTYPAAAPAYAPKPLRRTAFMTRGDLINAESRLGSTIFGPIPAGHRREFFHDQENIWIWFESWRDETDHPRQLTVRYEVRPSGVYKKISAGSYFKLTGDELENFRRATHAYLHIIKKYLYPNVATK